MKLRPVFSLLVPLAIAGGVFWVAQAEEKAPAKPLKVLLVCGGCCHDYATQKMLLAEGVSARANVEFTIEHNPDKSTKAAFEIYKSADWAAAYDVILHDECSADITDPVVVGNIVNAHKAGKPAVNLHCAMHSYRWGNFREPVKAGGDNASWYEMLGLQSTGHGPQEPIDIKFVDKNNPATKNLADWTTIKEELYNNVQVLTATPLAKGVQVVTDKKTGEKKTVESVVVWTNEFGPNKTRTWSTTIGHNNDTVGDARYLDMVTNGILWAAGKLGEDGKPVAGYEARQK
jgi:type 1 glutamine amidotransferase